MGSDRREQVIRELVEQICGDREWVTMRDRALEALAGRAWDAALEACEDAEQEEDADRGCLDCFVGFDARKCGALKWGFPLQRCRCACHERLPRTTHEDTKGGALPGEEGS